MPHPTLRQLVRLLPTTTPSAVKIASSVTTVDIDITLNETVADLATILTSALSPQPPSLIEMIRPRECLSKFKGIIEQYNLH